MQAGGEQGGTTPHENPIAVALGTLPNQVRAWTLTDAVDSGVNFTFEMPPNAAAATAFTVRPIWVPGSTDAVSHAVAWRMSTKIITASDVTAAGTVDTHTGDSAARTANTTVREAGKTVAITPSAGDVIRVSLSRDGAAAADTYVGDVHLLAVQIDYTSA